MLTVPDGSAESFDNSVKWIGCNLEYAPTQWSTARARAQQFGVRTIPWIRLCHPEHGEDFETLKQRLSLLTLTAQAWGENVILPNYEVEASLYAPADVMNHLRNVLDWDGEVGWSTLAWLQNDVDWQPLDRDAALLQIFPKDNGWMVEEIPYRMADCVVHARQEGLTYVGVTYQTYAGATPQWYDVASYQHSTFPGNVIAHGQWSSWYQ